MSFFRFVFIVMGLFWQPLLLAQSEFKYSYIPKKVYANQLFALTVIAIESSEESTPSFTFASESPLQPLFKTPLVIRNGSDIFYTFYFKATGKKIAIPALVISTDTQEISFRSKPIEIESLPKREDFCGVLAADMKIKSSQVSNYDEKNHIVTLSVEALEANLENMHLKKASESTIDTLKRHDAKVEAEFYFVMPVENTLLEFSYFNTIKKQFITLSVPIVIADDSVTTQSDLNPKEDSFERIKRYTFIFLVAFFLLMFLVKRDFFYLILGVVSLISLLTFYIPHQKICIKQGESLYILPTRTSTVSAIIEEEFETAILGKRKGFKKIEYKEGVIGWIKNEATCDH